MRFLKLINQSSCSLHTSESFRYLCLFYLLLSNVLIAQTSNSRMIAVETSIGPQVIFPDGSDFSAGNIEQKMKDFNINGISVAVINNGQIDWSKAYGVLKAGEAKKVTTTSLFQCASIGKVISTLAALQLVEDNLISLDENINNKLKRWAIEENDLTKETPVTLRHLLTHSSGLTDEYGFPGYRPGDNIPNVIQILNGENPSNTKKSLEIKTTPGQVEHYSGAGYLIIQILIEDLSGKSFVDYVQEKILLPFEMNNTTYDDRPDINMGKVIASGHRSIGKALKKKDYHIYPEKAAAGPWTTAEDLAKLIIGIQTTETPLIKEMLTPQINNKGLGVNLKGIHKPEAFWHAGQNEGYTGLLYGMSEDGKGAVVLTNSIGGEQFIQEFILPNDTL
ncbi:MAG: serine hydrolase domain-containing protein [Bacteroidota bacterium]